MWELAIFTSMSLRLFVCIVSPYVSMHVQSAITSVNMYEPIVCFYIDCIFVCILMYSLFLLSDVCIFCL